MSKIRIFITGATGVMGFASLKEFFKSKDRYEVKALARDSAKNRQKLADFQKEGLKVVWGDLLDEKSLEEGIKDADIVLHVGGMVSPEADFRPEQTLKVNIGSMKLIAGIVKRLEEADSEKTIKTVYIGSVSQYGPHLPPDHWKKVGDKLSAAKYDAYAISKIEAERILSTAGLRKWVSLRQTAILHPGLLKKADNPVMFHVPLNGAIEWVSAEDSGRLLERVCSGDVPESFWNNFYNVGGGESYRMTNYEFERKLLKAMGCPAPEKIFNTDWFATGNFHGVWYSDSDRLEEILHFRSGETFDEYMVKMKKELSWYFSLAPLAPSFLVKRFMKKVASTPPLGTLHWIKSGDTKRIEAFWGGIGNYKKIPGWKNLSIPDLEKKTPQREKINGSDSGYDKTLVKTMCPEGHEYLSSPFLTNIGGHGCPECLKKETEINF